jgi:hypothetical protein
VHEVRHPASGVGDANLLAAHLITGLVLAGFVFVGMRGYLRWIALAALPFILNAIVLNPEPGRVRGSICGRGTDRGSIRNVNSSAISAAKG